VDESSQPDDLDRLRGEFPGWSFGRIWITNSAGRTSDGCGVLRRGLPVIASAANLAAEVRKYTFPGRESSSR
jgi:hypothetical protein